MLYDSVRYTAPYRSPMHRHPAWQLTASLEGDFHFLTREKEFVIPPGGWILISPELVHSAGSPSEKSLAMQIFFRRFSPVLLPEAAERLNLKRGFLETGQTDLKFLMRTSRDFQRKGAENSPLAYSYRIALGLEFVLAALTDLLPRTNFEAKRNAKMERIMEYMEEHFAEPLCCADFAETAGLSPSRFSAIFRKAAGCSPMHFFNTIRLAHAQTFLLDGCSVEETSLRAGFSTVPYFCRCFRKHLGMSPGEFRKNPFFSVKPDSCRAWQSDFRGFVSFEDILR